MLVKMDIILVPKISLKNLQADSYLNTKEQKHKYGQYALRKKNVAGEIAV